MLETKSRHARAVGRVWAEQFPKNVANSKKVQLCCCHIPCLQLCMKHPDVPTSKVIAHASTPNGWPIAGTSILGKTMSLYV